MTILMIRRCLSDSHLIKIERELGLIYYKCWASEIVINFYNQKIVIYKFESITNKMSAKHSEIMSILKQAIQETPYLAELNLEFKEIKNLQPYLSYLKQLKSLKILNLFGNRLEGLPKDMSDLQSVEELDLANNELDKFNVRKTVESLKTMPNLKKLIYPVAKDQQKIIVQSMKKLQYLNNTKITWNQPKKAITLKYLNKNRLDAIRNQLNGQFSKILEFQNSYLDDVDTASAQKFNYENQIIIEQALKKVMNSGEQITENLQRIIDSITRYELYDGLKNRALNVCMDIFGDLGKFMKELSETQQKIFKDLAEQSLKLARIEYQYIQSEKQKKQNENQSLETKIFSKNAKLEKQLKRLKKQKDQYLGEINHLESQNKQYLEAIYRYVKGEKNSFVGIQQQHSNHNTKNNISVSTNVVKPPQKPMRQPGHTVPSHNITQNFPASINQSYISNTRMLSLKQLKDTIEQIYESKLKFDQKNLAGRIPRETMHQFLFTYLNQKYGLKSLTIEAANSIITGIQAYSGDDNDVAVFGKILKNQIDEEFRNVQNQLKSTINNLLKMHVKNQQPYRSAAEIQEMYSQKLNGELTMDEITDIVRYLYNKTDADRIIKKFEINIKKNRPREQTTRRIAAREQSNENRSKQKIKFSVFLKSVLDFQMKNHERLLKPLVRVFKMKDRDHDGIVNEDEFVSIIEEICEESQEIMSDLLMIVDPYQTKAITFTQTVRLAANYPQNNPILSRFIDQNEEQEDQD